MQLLRIVLASVVAVILTAGLFVFVGLLLPIWTMIAIYGRQAVQDSPGHGGVILFATVPIAGILSVPAFIYIAGKVYGRLRMLHRHQGASANF